MRKTSDLAVQGLLLEGRAFGYLEPSGIVCGDAREILGKIEKESVHLFLSDIPYGLGFSDWDVMHGHSNLSFMGESPAQKGKPAFRKRGKPINGWTLADRIVSREYKAWCDEWAKFVFPILKPGGNVLIFGARRTLHRAISALEDVGFLLRDLLVWEKPNQANRAQALSGVLERRGEVRRAGQWQGWRIGNLSPKFEPIAWMCKPYEGGLTDNILEHGVGGLNIADSLVDGKFPGNILRFGFAKGERGWHEAQKPLELLKFIIKLLTQEGQVVLDPFMGSGSTLVAAKQLKRKYLGIEIIKHNVETARKRLGE